MASRGLPALLPAVRRRSQRRPWVRRRRTGRAAADQPGVEIAPTPGGREPASTSQLAPSDFSTASLSRAALLGSSEQRTGLVDLGGDAVRLR